MIRCTVTKSFIMAMALALLAGLQIGTANAEILLSENFDGLTLKDSTSPTEINAMSVWTDTPPAGWTVDNSGVDPDGVPEFNGWTFLDKVWWVQTAGNQNRALFGLAGGNVALGDGDEWDDADPGPSGDMDTLLSTPSIDISSLGENELYLKFDSSWRDEDLQTAVVTVAYDGNPEIEVIRWESVAGPNFKDDNENEQVVIPLNNPDDVNNAVVTFKYIDATNDWWWAVDNVEIGTEESLQPVYVNQSFITSVTESSIIGSTTDSFDVSLRYDPGTTVFVTVDPGAQADFTLADAGGDGKVVLTFDSTNWDTPQPVTVEGANDEEIEAIEVFDVSFTVASTNTDIDGYTLNNVTVYVESEDLNIPGLILFEEDFESVTLLPAIEEGNSTGKASVWTDIPPAGWVMDESGVPGAGDVAQDGVTEWAGWCFADVDFWIQSDFQRREEFARGQGVVAVADPDEWDDKPHNSGTYDTFITSPIIPLVNVEPNSVVLKFDSSWRPEDDQKARLIAGFDAEDVTIFSWNSGTGVGEFKDDNSTNEALLYNIDSRADQLFVRFTFEMFDAGNDWWWAVDNILVSGDANPVGDLISVSKTGQKFNLFEESQLNMTTETFEVMLTKAPQSGSVTVTVYPTSLEDDITLSSPNGTLNGKNLELTFTQANVPQTVTVTVVNDEIEEGLESAPILFGTDSADDIRFADGYVSDYILLNVYDNEIGDLAVIETGTGTTVKETQGFDSYQVVLSKIPAGEVVVRIEDLNDPNQVNLNGDTVKFLTFNATAFAPQTVNVTGIEDGVIETDPHTTNVKHSISSTADLSYNSVNPVTIRVQILETACGAWGILPMDIAGGPDGGPDCVVDLKDLELFISQWFSCSVPYQSGCVDVR